MNFYILLGDFGITSRVLLCFQYLFALYCKFLFFYCIVRGKLCALKLGGKFMGGFKLVYFTIQFCVFYSMTSYFRTFLATLICFRWHQNYKHKGAKFEEFYTLLMLWSLNGLLYHQTVKIQSTFKSFIHQYRFQFPPSLICFATH
jgi:hypothetical protein